MAHTQAPAVAMAVGSLLALAGSGIDAAPQVRTVVVHVTDYAHVWAGDLAQAQRAAARPYVYAGVPLVWTNRGIATAKPDGALHLEVIILDAQMTDRLKPAEGALGIAHRASGRTHLFYGRIVTQAAESDTVLPRTLGYVLAHEVGHLILPEYSHASDGLMGPSFPDRIKDVPLFAPAEADMLRTVLSAAPDAAGVDRPTRSSGRLAGTTP